MYHKTYSCYIKYVTISNADSEKNNENQDDAIEKAEQIIEDHITHSNNNRLRSQKSLKRPAEIQDQTKINCTYCGHISFKSDVKKSRIELPEKAQEFLTMTQKLQDETFCRTAHLQSIDSILHDGVYYHAACLLEYKNKYNKHLKNESGTHTSPDARTENNVDIYEKEIISDKLKLTKEFIESIEFRLLAGEAFELSSLTETIKTKYRLGDGFDNRFVKNVLIDHFGENIGFSYPKQKNRSAMVFCAKMTKSEMADVIRSDRTSIMKQSATELRTSLKKIDFELKDKYCDENDLRTSWYNFEIPPAFVEFFSAFFNIDALRLKNDKPNKKKKLDLKVLKIKCIMQTLYYILNDGRKRTPLQVSTGLSIHSETRSKNVINQLNHIGLSISYTEIERYKTGLASFAAKSAETITPLPCHFDPKNFTVAAFDNFDHRSYSVSGKEECHDTVSVVVQKKTLSTNFRKPNIANADDHQSRSLVKQLKCQMKKDFGKIPKRITLPESFVASTEEDLVTVDSYCRTILPEDLAWLLCRMNISDDAECKLSLCDIKEQEIPSWSAFHSLTQEDTRPCSQMGFLPVLPHPVTQHDTVYTALCNFKEILEQLDQQYLPVVCDEGVYKLARPMKFMRDEEMKQLFIMLGDFHDENISYDCIGKYLTDCGILEILIETNIFGKHVAEQALRGDHYDRSTKLYFIINEALTRLQLKAFFTLERLQKYKNELEILEDLKNAISEESVDEAKKLLEIFTERSQALINDFEKFVAIRSNESPMFRYFNNVLIMIGIVHNKHKSIRTGNWNMYVDSLKKQQPIFHVTDRIHYSRFGPIHLEDCLNLERDMPQVYNQFIMGAFTVKLTDRPFSSIAIDQSLESGINKPAKGPEGVKGLTKKKDAVTVWNLIFHEMIGISSFYREILGLQNDNDDLAVHHELNTSTTEFFEESVSKLVKYFLARINPFQDGVMPLQDLVGGQLVDEKAAEKLLNVFEIGCAKFNEFRQKRIVKKEVPLSDTIHQTKLPSFKTTYTEAVKKKASQKLDSVHQSHRIIDIARERNYDIKKLLGYDITPVNVLFDEEGLITKVTDKSDLTNTLELVSKLNLDSDYKIGNHTKLSVIVDVMLYCRKVSFKNLKTFSNFAEAFCTYINSSISAYDVDRIDFIFDDYFENSPKASTRLHRSKDGSIPLANIKSDTPLPNQEEKFWPSQKNKQMLQVFLRNYILINCNSKWPGVEIVFSTLQSLESISTLSHLKNDPAMSMLQRFDIEEADTKIILHVNNCSIEKAEKILVLSCDTDVLTLLLNFWKDFSSNGLQVLHYK